jgi:hypothetical protein
MLDKGMKSIDLNYLTFKYFGFEHIQKCVVHTEFDIYDFIIVINSLFLYPGSPHLQTIGKLDFFLRDHEGEVKA